MIAADEPQANIFQGMSGEDRGTLRANMIDLILGMPTLTQCLGKALKAQCPPRVTIAEKWTYS